MYACAQAKSQPLSQSCSKTQPSKSITKHRNLGTFVVIQIHQNLLTFLLLRCCKVRWISSGLRYAFLPPKHLSLSPHHKSEPANSWSTCSSWLGDWSVGLSSQVCIITLNMSLWNLNPKPVESGYIPAWTCKSLIYMQQWVGDWSVGLSHVCITLNIRLSVEPKP
jgi:hypothetical protein